MMIVNAGRLRRFFALFLVLLLAVTGMQAAFADSTDSSDAPEGIAMESGSASEYTSVTARFYQELTGSMTDLTIDYSDAFFTRDPDIFYLDLARASFGLALAASRNTRDAGAAPDTHVENFLTDAGFENFESTWYDQDPTADTVASAIAAKKLGDTTVIAVVCCGSGYGAEWLSNLTVGTGTEHEGFSQAADLVRQRLMDYIRRYEITGDVKLWVAGYSRAAAVGNLLAVRMTQSGQFSAVYGYFFATPNNTQEPVACANLFNIVGQNDPVAQIPLSCWGYGRSGVDLYTPAQETNSSYLTKALLADDFMSAQIDQSFRNNPDLNRQLHVVFEYLSAIVPTAQDYAQTLQPLLLSAYNNHSGGDLLVALQEVLTDINDLPPDRQNAVDALADYLNLVIYQYIGNNAYQTRDGSWDSSVILSQNVALEHMPFIYASWLFSTDDPAQLFVDGTRTMRLVIEGSFDLEVWDRYGIVQSITSDNEEDIYAPGAEARSEDGDLVYLYASDHNGKAVVQIPADRDYTLKLYFGKSGAVSLFTDEYAYEAWNNDVSDVILFTAQKGDCIVLSDLRGADGVQVSTADGQAVLCLRQQLSADTQSILAREQMMGQNFSMWDIITALLIFVLLTLAVLLAALLIFLIGRKKNRDRTKTAVTVCFVIVTLVLGTGAVYFSILLPNIRTAAAGFAALAGIFVCINTLRCRRIKAAGISVLLTALAFADYYLFFSRDHVALNAVILALLLLSGIALPRLHPIRGTQHPIRGTQHPIRATQHLHAARLRR